VFRGYSEQLGYVTSIYLLNKDSFYFKTKKKTNKHADNLK